MSGTYSAIRVAGGLLPDDIRAAISAGSAAGMASGDYHLGGERPREAAARTWTYLQGVYRRFRDDLARLPDGDPAVGLTRERWLGQLFSTLDYGRLPHTPAGGLTVGDKSYPISHVWGATPIHLLGWNVPLDRRTSGVPGAAQRAPHALVQEFLNRTDQYLWGIVSNGRQLRLLRDSTSLTGQAYVEYDLESIFDGDLYADYTQLYLTVHQSRVEVPGNALPSGCWLERWRTTAISQGVRALNLLRDGVQDALQTLGTGFLQHPANHRLRDQLDAGDIRLRDLHQALLRTVYRLLFWAVAEDRGVLLDPDTDQATAARYAQYFSSTRLRALARKRHGTNHHDLWQAVILVFTALSQPAGEPRIGLPGLGGLFFAQPGDPLDNAQLSNQALLSAVRSLSIVHPKGQPRRMVDFANLGAEELGSIYESLLELVPRRDPLAQTFTLETLAGNDRKTSGSYYTPSELVDLVLDTALDPVLDHAEKSSEPEAALLAVTVCDPAIGSGHFMVAAARRIATRLAMIRTGEVDPTPTMLNDAMHDVIARCIYGVDINPMAADLAKVSLWLEAMAPGKPLSFLDHHIKVGNSLLGTTPALLAAGIPDAAYTALTGDDRAVVRAWKKLNQEQRSGQTSLLDEPGVDVSNAAQVTATQEVADRVVAAGALADIAWASQRYGKLQASAELVNARNAADGWCAAFLTVKAPDAPPITHDTVEAVARGTADHQTTTAVVAVAARHRLFHWHLEFPEIFQVPSSEPVNSPTGWRGGFSAVLGNPPWETLQMTEKEFFATRAPEIADAANAAARRRLIQLLEETNPELHGDYLLESRRVSAEVHLIKDSDRFPLTARGKINTYSVFAEHFRTTLANHGRSGVITPTGLATDATTAPFFSDSIRAQRLAAFYDFENESKIFTDVHHSFRFAVSSITGGEPIKDVRLSFLSRQVADAVGRRFKLAAHEIEMLNPNTGTLPIFRSRRDADITINCYRRHPVLIRDGYRDGNPWGLTFKQGLFNMASDSSLFRTAHDLGAEGAEFDGWAWARGDQRWLPLYEAKMLSHWNHRFSTYAGATQAQLNMGTLPRLTTGELDNPETEARADAWVPESDVQTALSSVANDGWLLGWRNITRTNNFRTFIPCALPATAVGHSFPIFSGHSHNLILLHAVMSSLVFDYVARQKLSGTNMVYFVVNQLACPTPKSMMQIPGWLQRPFSAFVHERALELTYTSDRIEPYTLRAPDGLVGGAPFRWLPERRAQISAELDAGFMHSYGVSRADADYILDSFDVMRRSEESDLGEFRTKRLVLAEFDAMTRAGDSGIPYKSPLDPPPGHGPRHEATP